MPAPTEASPGAPKEAKVKYDSADYVKSLEEQLYGPKADEEAAKELPDDAKRELNRAVDVAGREKFEAADAARDRVDAIHADIDGSLRAMLLEETRLHAGSKAFEAAGSDTTKAAAVKAKTDEELSDLGLEGLVRTATIDAVYARLKEIAPGKLKRAIGELAATMPEYQFDDPHISGADVLEADLERNFTDMSTNIKEYREARKEVTTGFLGKRAETTRKFIEARQGIDTARRTGEATAQDITAMKDNIEGTYGATKEMNKQVDKGRLVSRRKFWDSETKTHIIELVYEVKKADGTIDPQEAVVEHWNNSKDGGEMIRSVYIRTGKETVKKGLQLKFWKGRKKVERDAKAIKHRKMPAVKFDKDLSKAAREQMTSLSAESIEASRRSEGKVDGLKGRKATRAKLNGRMTGTMGLAGKEATRASRLGQGRAKTFMQDLTERLFYNSKKMATKVG